MAHRKTSAPKRGSLGVRPRKRSSDFLPTVRSWPTINVDTPTLLGFLGYKVGMTHAIVVDDRPGSPTEGREIYIPVTIVETPSIVPLALRVYGVNSYGGLDILQDIWIEPPKELEIWRSIPTYRPTSNINDKINMVKSNIGSVKRVSLVLASNVKEVGGLSKKTPDIIEICIGGGDISNRIDYAINLLGKYITVDQVFQAGHFIDVIGVTKGKGFQGVIKRFGVKELPRWHKHRKGSRRVGSRSPTLGSMSEVPQPGQMGLHRRTEYNKRIIMIGENGYEITPAGGFPHYGIIKSKWIILWGSIPGVPKRPVVLRWPIRPPAWKPKAAPQIVYISLESKIAG
jgi:large subunit ribosomal protein L3